MEELYVTLISSKYTNSLAAVESLKYERVS